MSTQPTRVTLAISPLGDDEVDALCALAREIWREHYPPIIGAAQTEYMLAQRYDPPVVRGELARTDVWWDTLSDDGKIIAFASSFADGPGEIKLDKLYVRADRQRLGYGAALIEHTCDRAARLGYERIVLAVNKRNASAIAAYERHGFRIRESVVKDIGGGFVMDDYVMERLIAPLSPRERGRGSGAVGEGASD